MANYRDPTVRETYDDLYVFDTLLRGAKKRSIRVGSRPKRRSQHAIVNKA